MQWLNEQRAKESNTDTNRSTKSVASIQKQSRRTVNETL